MIKTSMTLSPKKKSQGTKKEVKNSEVFENDPN